MEMSVCSSQAIYAEIMLSLFTANFAAILSYIMQNILSDTRKLLKGKFEKA